MRPFAWGGVSDLIDDPRRIDLTADGGLRPADFSVPLYGQIYARMLEMSAAGGAIDTTTLGPFFATEEEWPRARAVLAAAAMNPGPLTRTKGYFDQIRMLSQRRRMTAGLQDVVTSARNLDVTREELLAQANVTQPVEWITARFRSAGEQEDEARSISRATAERYRRMDMAGPPRAAGEGR